MLGFHLFILSTKNTKVESLRLDLKRDFNQNSNNRELDAMGGEEAATIPRQDASLIKLCGSELLQKVDQLCKRFTYLPKIFDFYMAAKSRGISNLLRI